MLPFLLPCIKEKVLDFLVGSAESNKKTYSRCMHALEEVFSFFRFRGCMHDNFKLVHSGPMTYMHCKKCRVYISLKVI